MCKILMTVSAEAEEKTEPNRVQKRTDFSFIVSKGAKHLNAKVVTDRKRKLRKKRQKLILFRKK